MFVVGWSGKMFGLWQCCLCVPLHNYVPSSGPQYLIAAHKKRPLQNLQRTIFKH